MMKNATVETIGAEESQKPFCREEIHRLLDKAPDGYKLLARLVEDPCELVQHYDPASNDKTSPIAGRPEDFLRKWLITRMAQENW
jgi:hypothetical protein